MLKSVTLRFGLVVFLAGVVGGGVAVSRVWRTRNLTRAEVPLVGNWYSGNGFGAIEISLSANGRYSGRANQCVGETGRGWGRWEESNGYLVFHPILDWGDLEDVRILQITNVAGSAFLVKTDRFAQQNVVEFGVKRANAFKKDSWW